MPGIGVISNPMSKQNMKDPELMHMAGYIVGQTGVNAITESLEHLKDEIRSFKRFGIEIIAVNGGDGTNHQTVTAIIDVYNESPVRPLPMITFLRGGTVNTIATGCGIKGRTKWLLHNLKTKYEKSGLAEFQTIQRETLEIEGRYGFLFGAGWVDSFMRDYYGNDVQGKEVSKLQAAMKIIRNIYHGLLDSDYFRENFGAKSYEVEVDGELFYNGKLSIILCSQIPTIGLGCHPFVHCDSRENAFHFVAFRDVTMMQVVAEIIPSYMRRAMNPEKTIEQVPRNLILRTSEPIPYTFDGDMYTCEKKKQEQYVLESNSGPVLTIIQR